MNKAEITALNEKINNVSNVLTDLQSDMQILMEKLLENKRLLEEHNLLKQNLDKVKASSEAGIKEARLFNELVRKLNH